MSFMTTQSGTLTPVPNTAKARSHAGGSTDPANRRIERRRNGSPGDSPLDILERMPAVVVLERLPIPALAMLRDGTVLYANTTFAEMVGYQRERLTGLAFPLVFNTVPDTVLALSGLDALANLIVELKHCEGWPVRARMSKSALLRRDDPVVLVTFQDLTERIWMDED